MSATDPAMSSFQRAVTARQCRAYCGPAHGQTWLLEPGAEPPTAVKAGNDRQLVYRLIYRLDTGEPALDDLGNYLYLPVLCSLLCDPGQGEADTTDRLSSRRPGQLSAYGNDRGLNRDLLLPRPRHVRRMAPMTPVGRRFDGVSLGDPPDQPHRPYRAQTRRSGNHSRSSCDAAN